MPVAGSHVRQLEAGRGLEPRGGPSGPLNSQVVPRVDMLQLGTEDAGMEIVEPAVETKAVDITFGRPVVAQLADSGVDVRVVREEGPTVTKRAEVLLNDEADGSRVAQLADRETIAGGVDSLRVVLITQVVCVGDFPDCSHIGALTVEVHGNDGLRLAA